MSPSDLPWWAWLVSSLGALAIGYFLVAGTSGTIGIRSRNETRKMALTIDAFFIILRVLGVLFVLCGVGCLLISVVRFIKWAWAG